VERRITIVDVAARDGLQNEATHLGTEDKLRLIEGLVAAGVRRYEATSFVHPKLVPQMADAEAVFQGLPKEADAVPIALVVNDVGYRRAVAAGARHVRLVVAATEQMNQANARASPAATMASYRPLMAEASATGVEVTGVIGVSFGCPFEGAVDPERVLELAAAFVDGGATEVDFADTVGMAVPSQVERMLTRARDLFPGTRLGVHLHNTRNTGLANAYAAYLAGATVLDGSLGGVGGCPFAPRATGNVPTEDLVFMFEGMGVETGIDLDALIEHARWLEGALGHPLPGMVMKAGACWTGTAPHA
jgi:hydroxymethylglutaryl-CoA lyase